MITTLADAKVALKQAIDDATGDYPDVGADDIAHDMVAAVTWDCTPEVGAELCRTELGFVPFDANPACKGFFTEED